MISISFLIAILFVINVACQSVRDPNTFNPSDYQHYKQMIDGGKNICPCNGQNIVEKSRDISRGGLKVYWELLPGGLLVLFLFLFFNFIFIFIVLFCLSLNSFFFKKKYNKKELILNSCWLVQQLDMFLLDG